MRGFYKVISLAVTYFHMANATLSSALSVFTSEFEMESGGSHLLLPPGKSDVAYPEAARTEGPP